MSRYTNHSHGRADVPGGVDGTHVDCSKCNRDIFIRPRHNAYHYKCSMCSKYYHKFCIYVDKALAKRIKDNTDVYICNSCFQNIFPFHYLSNFEFKRTLFVNDVHDFENLPDLADVEIYNDHDNPFHTFKSSPYITADKFHRYNFDCSSLSLLHVNLNSLNTNSLDNLTTLIQPLKANLNFIAISETRFNSKTDFANFKIPGYKPLDIDLVDNSPTLAGGVALFHEQNLNVIPRPDLKIKLDYVENIWVELIQPGNTKNIIVGVVYRHPRKIVSEIENFTDALNDTLLKINSESKTSYFCGDLNLNLIDYCNNTHISNFVDMIYSNSFFPCITKPTRIVPHHTPSLIDHIYSNSMSSYIKSGICLYPIADGHLPVFCVSDTKLHKIKKNCIIRDYKKFNKEEFLRHLQFAFCDFNEKTKDTTDVNELYNLFHDTFSLTLNDHAPIKKLSVRQQKIMLRPWLTRGILNSIKNKTKMHKSHYIFGDILMRTFYKKYCNTLKRCIEKSKINHYQMTFENLKNDIKKTWKTINEIVNIKSKNYSSPNLIKINDENITDPKLISNLFNDYFKNVGPNLARAIPRSRSNFKDFLGEKNRNKFRIKTCTENEIGMLITNLKLSNSEGIDNIPTRIVKISNHLISSHLARIFNLSIKTATFPDRLKYAKIIPIYKADKRTILSNYRPISILSPISKLIERLIFNNLLRFLLDNNILFKYQFGFRENYSTELALVEISDKIYKSLDNSEFFFALYLDLSKAFDTVDFDILLYKLKHYGIRGSAHQWFKSYLTNRTQQVEIDGCTSDSLITVCGVPQGSVLGPLLFLLYINDLPNSTSKFNFRLFADDTKIYVSHSNLSEIQQIINSEIPKITDWLSANKLSPNLSKTKYVLFKDPHKVENLELKVELSNSIINRAYFAKHLGIIFDSDMSWKSQCKAVSLKISRAVGILYKLKNYANLKILRNIYFATLYCHLNYGILSWGAAALKHINPIQVKQNLFLKIMYKLDMMYNTNRLYFNFKFLKINEIYHAKCLQFIHRYHSNLLPSAFENFLTLANSIHSHNTRYASQDNYYIEIVHNTYGLKSPSFTANKLWSQIPTFTKSFEPIRFKKFVFNYLLSRYA